MTSNTRWTRVLAVCACASFAFQPWRKRHSEKQAHKAQLHEWENEGGNLAPAPEVSPTVLTAGSP